MPLPRVRAWRGRATAMARPSDGGSLKTICKGMQRADSPRRVARRDLPERCKRAVPEAPARRNASLEVTTPRPDHER